MTEETKIEKKEDVNPETSAVKEESKPEDGKKLIQEEKLKTVQEIIEEKPKKKKGWPKGKKRGPRKKKIIEPEPEPEAPFDPIKAEQEAEFMLAMCVTIRQGLGVTKPIPDIAVGSFKASYVELSKKYGDVATRYMPEIMMVGSCVIIAYDTAKEVKKIKETQTNEE